MKDPAATPHQPIHPISSMSPCHGIRRLTAPLSSTCVAGGVLRERASQRRQCPRGPSARHGPHHQLHRLRQVSHGPPLHPLLLSLSLPRPLTYDVSSSWSDPESDLPLQYSFYLDARDGASSLTLLRKLDSSSSCKVGAASATLPSCFYKLPPASNEASLKCLSLLSLLVAQTVLPAGNNMTVKATVCDSYGACNTTNALPDVTAVQLSTQQVRGRAERRKGVKDESLPT